MSGLESGFSSLGEGDGVMDTEVKNGGGRVIWVGWRGVEPESKGMGAAGVSEKGAWPAEDSEESEKRDSKRDIDGRRIELGGSASRTTLGCLTQRGEASAHEDNDAKRI